MEFQLLQLVRSAQRRLRGFRRWVAITLIGLIAAVICGHTLWRAEPDSGLAHLGWVVALGTGLAVALTFVDGRVAYHDVTDVARRIERRYPALRQRLITAINQVGQSTGELSYLQRKVVGEAVRHGYIYRWQDVVSRPRMLLARAAGLLAIVIVGLLCARLIATGRPVRSAAESSPPTASPLDTYEVSIEPGNTSIERGTSVLIMARFTSKVPDEAAVHLTNQLDQVRTFPMKRSLDDPLFGVAVPQINEALTYQVEFDSHTSPVYRIDVFDYPELLQADAELEFPSYTNLPAKTIADTRRVTAVEGSQLTWIIRANKPLASAVLLDREGQSLTLDVDPARPDVFRTTLAVQADHRWELVLTDHEGRTNKTPPELVAKSTPNRPPTIKLSLAQDVRVSPIEELGVSASVWDDYGLVRYGIAYSLATQTPQEIVLGENLPPRAEQIANYLIDFETLEAAPDQLLSYHFWAEDIGPDHQPRRTSSDMFFAEVRHFEEIFRQGQQPQGESAEPAGGGNQNTQRAEQLIEIQKQIINATWNIIRRGAPAASDRQFAEDTELVLESQESALTQLSDLAQQLQDSQSMDYVEQIGASMEQAIDNLRTALDTASVTSLGDAIGAEQASYQGLLQLRAREFEVVRSSRRSNSSSAAGGAARNQFQQQLQELELDDDPNRYETQRRAQQNEPPQAEQEVSQILSRLNDLARRQADINQRLQDLQTALEQAESEEQREEIRRQLKRLRDQQEDLLRDADELNERLQQAQDQPQLEPTRQQLDDSRQNLQQVADALNREEVSEALATGTRTERQFEQMRDELRQQTAEQFATEMRSLRRDVRQLDERQQEVSEKMAELDSVQQPGLRPNASQDGISDSLLEQEQSLNELLNRIQQTVLDAEESQPLLARKLYEAHRKASRERASDNLRDAGQLLDQGLREQARELEQQATTAVHDLRQGVEEAAEAILGDEVEALRRATSNLSELMRQIENEIAAHSTDAEDGQQQQGNQQQGNQQQGNQQQDNQQQDNQQQGNQQQGNQQQGNQQQGNQQQGNQQQGNQQQRNQSPGERQSRRDGGGGLFDTLTDSLGSGPITGDDFRAWSDNLREVEEILDDEELRSQAAQIRDRARSFRLDFRRHSQEPQWSLVEDMVAEPIRELRQRVTEELLRRSGQRQQLVPVDRDPVPDIFSERVRLYYEALGEGE